MLATVMYFLPFQIRQHYRNNEEVQTQQEIEMDFQRMASLINKEVMSVFDIMFWRGTAILRVAKQMTVVIKSMP